MKKRLSLEHLEHRLLLCGSAIHDTFSPNGLTNGAARDTSVSASLAPEIDLGTMDGTRAFRGTVGGRDSVDLLGFTIENESDIDISLAGRFGQRLTLLDNRLRVVESDSINRFEDASVERTVAAGQYYISVRSSSWFSDHYQLRLDVEQSIPDGAGNTLATAYQLGALTSKTLNGHVGGKDTADVFQFNVHEDSKVIFGLDGLASDIDLYVVNDRGQVEASSRNSQSADESIEHQFEAGTYYTIVRPYQNSVSNYRFQISSSAAQPITPAPAMPPAGDTTPPSGADLGSTRLPPVPYFGGTNEWNLNSVDAPESWSAGFTGDDVIVAVVDTGIDLQHADLNQNLWTNTLEIAGDGIDNDRNGFVDDVYGWNFAAHNNNPDDANGHGTHVAGTIAAEFNSMGATGIAYDATVMPVKVLGNDGSGSDWSVANGIRYAVDNGADVINLSLGSNSNSRRIRSALEYALASDVFVVAASGNEGSATPSYPAMHSRDLDNVLSVGAYDRNDTAAGFSNAVGNSHASQVDAPGVRIYSTLPGNRFGTLSGTSMAAPHVAGVAALTLSADPNLTAAELKSLLMQQVSSAPRGSDARGVVDASLVVARARRDSNVSTASIGGPSGGHSNHASIDWFFATAPIG